MLQMPIVDLLERARRLGESGRRVDVLWQDSESIGFLARGREYRSEFHVNPSDEVMVMVRGEMRLHHRAPAGEEAVAIVPQGSTIFTPAGIPHSPRFPADAFALILERRRRPGEVDRFQWYCPECDALLHEEHCVVDDYRADPVSKAYQRFFDDEQARTCKRCGAVMPRP
jgi:3-hydroxyanthranilate 3,4-dioxygenase